MRTSLPRVGLALALLALVPSCAAPVAPEGFTLGIQLTHVNVRAVDSLRITVAPVMEGARRGHFLQPTQTSFENGGIVVSVDSVSGLLTINVSGAHFAEHATSDALGNDPFLPLELWTDDGDSHGMPQVRATVMSPRGDQIATGVGYLPSWPLVLGDSVIIAVPCVTGLDAQCAGP